MVVSALDERLLQHEVELVVSVSCLSTLCRGMLLASGHITLKVDVPDRRSLDQGLRMCICISLT